MKVPKTVAALLAAGVAEADVQRLVWDNPIALFGQSGRLEIEDAGADAPDPQATFAGNSILRGAREG